MKAKQALAILFLGWILPLSAQDSPPHVTVRLAGAGAGELSEALAEQAGVHLYYREEWMEGVVIDLSAEDTEVTEVMRRALAGTGLHFYYFPPNRIMILPDRKLQTDLSFLTGPGEGREAAVRGDTTRNTGGSYLRGARPEQLVRTLVIGEKRAGSGRAAARIRGRITDLESGQPVIGATMVLTGTGKGSISDATGMVNMSMLPGRYEAQFSFIGMETVKCMLEVLSDGEFQIEMRPTVISLNEVQIVGNHYRDIQTTDVGVERLSMKTLKQMPLFMGENDVIKISRLLPGITSAGEASTGVNVRGGNADQNLFYINRIPIYNTSHMFGFLSAFNSDIIHDFSVYKGNVPVNYGGRLSSVFNIVTRKGNRKNFTAHAGISPVSAHATLEAPLVKEHASFLVSGRSSYSDWILQRMEDPLLRESNASFYDVAASVDVTPDDKNDISGFYYRSFDRFGYGDISDYEYSNQGGSLIWKHAFSPALTASFTGALSGYSFATRQNQEASQAYSHRYQLRHNEFLTEFSWVPALNHHIDFGGSVIYYALDRGQVLPSGESSLRTPVDLGSEKGVEGSLFVSDNLTLLPWLSLYAGLRYSFFSALGPADVRRYAEGAPLTEGNVTDTVHYGNNEPYTFESGPELRLALNIRTGQNTSVKLSFSQMRQYLFMLSNTTTISPTDQWKLADPHIAPLRGYQVTSGIHHIWPRAGLSGSVEIYYKPAKNVVEFRDGANFVGSPYTETAVLQGSQQAYGAEFMLQKGSGRLNGWVSYTYSRSLVTVKGAFESINRGEPYPSNYDRPHVLNLIWNYHLSRRFTFSSNLVYMTGRPVTFPSSLYLVDDQVYIDYDSKNQVRVPDYFRIDASLTIEGNLKANKRFHSTWSFNVYNVLGRNNPQSIFFEPVEHYLNGYSFSVIGVPIFTVSWNIKMGNYESN
jgi:hypothetical protein